jgi:SAM-dependent methyltransferase
LSRLRAFLHRGPRHAVKRIYYAARAPKAGCFPLVAERLTGRGLEIGGPSPIFARRGLLPVYPDLGELDNYNFGPETVWEGHLAEGRHFRAGKRTGFQFVSEAFALKAADASYDFVLSSHMLEHSANPIRVLAEWRRVLRPRGHLLLVLPDGARTMDHRRPITALAHLVEDFNAGTGEDDRTHIEEVVALHDLAWTPEYADREAIRKTLANNEQHRMLHHHVFDMQLAVELVRHAGFDVLAQESAYPVHLIVLAQSSGRAAPAPAAGRPRGP